MDRRRWRRAWTVVAAAGGIAAGVSCSLLVGGFKECETETDCASRVTDGGAFNYICSTGYCLPIDRRCTILGPKTGDAVVWGAIWPKTLTTGAPHQWGPSWERAIELLINELNPPVRTGIQNRPIRVYSCDSQSNNTTAADLASYLVNTVKVPVIISDGSGETIAESRITIPAGVLLVAGAATSPELTNLADAAPDGGSVGMVWRTTPSDALQAPIIARQILGDAGTPVPKVFVFARDDAFGQPLASLFSASYPQALADGGPAKATYFINPNDLSTVTPALNQAEAFGPNIMVVIGFPAELVAIINGTASHPGLSSASWFFTQNAKFPALFTQVDGGVPIQGARGTSPSAGYDNSEPSLFFRPKFEQTYSTLFNSVVDLSNVYDAAFLVALATDYSYTRDGNANGVRMAEAFTRFSSDAGRLISLVPSRFSEGISELAANREINVEGASGHLDFNNVTGEAPADYEVWKIVGTNFVTQYTVSP
ncbi:MAG TPA: ABC transporter substrate-binding protein [Myxococcales bacterium]|nr:ABC transporter substrate-binding protein [Myxococcales bacterium]